MVKYKTNYDSQDYDKLTNSGHTTWHGGSQEENSTFWGEQVEAFTKEGAFMEVMTDEWHLKRKRLNILGNENERELEM